MRRRRNEYVFMTYSHRERPRRGLLYTMITLCVIIAVILTTNYIISHQVRLTETRVTVQNLHPDLENWSILHFSDLNGQSLGENQQLIKRVIANERYSTVVFTGDMIGPDGNVQPFLDLVALLPSDVPKFLIVGDGDPSILDATAHGSLSPYADWALAAQEAGVIILDEPYEVVRGKGSVWYVPEYLYSLDLDSMEASYEAVIESIDALGGSLTPDQAAQRRVAEYQLDKIARIRELKKQITEDDVQIVLSHTPVTNEYFSTMLSWQDKSNPFSIRHASLILSGHYCAGQWRIPGVGAIWAPELGWFPEETQISGLSYLVGIPQHISPGLGASTAYPMPGRLYNPPAVSIIYLTTRLIPE